MKIQDFSAHLLRLSEQARQAVRRDLPPLIGNIAVSLFKQNFQDEGFFGNRWQEVRRRLDPRTRGAAASRKILTGPTGNLGRSISATAIDSAAVISSDLPYASAHNDGTSNAGRSHNVRIPQRKFIGESTELTNAVSKAINTHINKILNP